MHVVNFTMSSWGKEAWWQWFYFSVLKRTSYLVYRCLLQDCSNSIANTLELLQSCTKPSIYVETSLLHDYVMLFHMNLFLQILKKWNIWTIQLKVAFLSLALWFAWQIILWVYCYWILDPIKFYDTDDRYFVSCIVSNTKCIISWLKLSYMACKVSPRWAPCWPHEPCYQGWLAFRMIHHSPWLHVPWFT